MNDIKKHEPTTIKYVDSKGQETVRTHIFFSDQTKWENVSSLDVSHLDEEQLAELVSIVKEYSEYVEQQHIMSIQNFFHMKFGEEIDESLIKFRSLKVPNISKEG